MKHYAIGDVHGEFDTLIKLTEKLPEDAKLVFVGDLIDRGPDSSKVVDFVRNGNHQCVLGNHEDMMIEEGEKMSRLRENYTLDELWAINGGLETLESYGIVETSDDGKRFKYTKNKESIDKFIDDAEWMETLPLGVEIRRDDIYLAVISHSTISTVWDNSLRNIKRGDKNYEKMKHHIIWNRSKPFSDRSPTETFPHMCNVVGHTITKEVDARYGWVNIDTGCTSRGKLTALNLETLEVEAQVYKVV